MIRLCEPPSEINQCLYPVVKASKDLHQTEPRRSLPPCTWRLLRNVSYFSLSHFYVSLCLSSCRKVCKQPQSKGHRLIADFSVLGKVIIKTSAVAYLGK